MGSSALCPVCCIDKTIPVFNKNNMPRYSCERYFTRESALNAPKEKVDFHFCVNCQFMFNRAFNSSEMDYLINYEVSRSYSEYFSNYLLSVCREINETFPLANKTVVEVGCGDGQFLMHLGELFKFKGWGFEPSLSKSHRQFSHKDLGFIGDYYNREYLTTDPDLIILRHVLEHQGDPFSFLDSIIGGRCSSSCAVYVEVPALEWIVDNEQVNAFSHDHCSYFSRSSLDLVHRRLGYVCKQMSFTFEDEYLQYFGTRSAPYESSRYTLPPNGSGSSKPDSDSGADRTIAFSKRIPTILEGLKEIFSEDNGKTILWGAGGKGITLLNILDITYKQLPFVVDINPERNNTYIPVSGQQIISPQRLQAIQPQTVIITNASYSNEIAVQLQRLGVQAKIRHVLC